MDGKIIYKKTKYVEKETLLICLLCLCVCRGTAPLSAVRAWAEEVPVRLDFARDGDSIVVAVHLSIPPGYHAYAHEAGDAGRPTVLDFALEGGQMLPVWYPAGAMQRDFYDPEATIFAYEGEVVLFSVLPEQAVGKPYTAGLSMLLCSNRNCLPINQSFTGVVPQSLPPVGGASWTGQWHKLKKIPSLVLGRRAGRPGHRSFRSQDGRAAGPAFGRGRSRCAGKRGGRASRRAGQRASAAAGGL